MVNLNELKNKQKELIANLSEEELKEYILYLTKCYYDSFKENDVKHFKNNIQLLKELIETYKDQYSNIIGYIYFSLCFNSNNFLNNIGLDSDIELTLPFNYNLYESEEEEELTHNIRKIFNKERVRERYNEERTG